MKKRFFTWGLCLLMVGLVAGVAYAQFAKTEEAIKYRQSVMSVVGTHFTRMGAVVKGEQPFTQESFEQNANLVATLIKLPWDAYMMPGSDRGSKMKRDALAQKEKFMGLAKANEAEIAKLAAAAKAGDFNAAKSQFGAAGASCKACHDDYRSR
ncbi:MAG: cytochrome c [Desulfobacterales bacterium]